MGDDKKAGKQFLVLIGESNFKELSKLCAKGPLDPDLMSYENAGGNTALLVAAQRGSEKIAIELIKILYNNAPQGSINVNHQNKQQMTALHFASQSGFGSIVEMLLDKDAEFEVKNEEGKMPIQLSTNPMCERLLQAKIDARRAAEKDAEIKAMARQLCTLIKASPYDETATMKYLTALKWKEALNYVLRPEDLASTPFWEAVLAAKSVELVSIMIKLGASVSCVDGKNRTPVMRVVMMDRKPSYPTTKLSRDLEAIRFGILKAMCESKDKDHWNMTDNQGYSCLMWACMKNHVEDIQLILDKGYADPDMKQQVFDPKKYPYRGKTIGDAQQFNDAAIHFASKRFNYGCIRALLDGGADIDSMGFDGMTAFMWQMYFGKKEGVKLLREWGADPNKQLDGNIDIYISNPEMRTRRGNCGLTLCADMCNSETLDVLKYVLLQDIEVPQDEELEEDESEEPAPQIKRNIFKEKLPEIPLNVNICQTNGANCLQTLCRKSREIKDQALLLEVVEILIRRGCDVNNQTTEGYTPLMWCVRFDNKPLARLLLNAKADPKIKNRENKDCFRIAGKKNEPMITFLNAYNIAGT